jgi:recombination protein RecA
MTEAKKKKETKKKPNDEPLHLKNIRKKYGNVIIPISDFLERETQVIPVGPNLDAALNGGVPEGSWMIMSGPPKCGKSTTALQIAANAQAQGRKVYYFDVEGRIKPMQLNGISNLKQGPEHFQMIATPEEATAEEILSAEDFVNIASDIIKNESRVVIILDSTSSLCSQDELDGEITGGGRAKGPRILASFCRKMGTVVPVRKATVIMMQHLIANTSGYGAPYMEDSGRKVQYQADIKLRCKTFQYWKDRNDTLIGQIPTWQVVTSALGPPVEKVESYLRYNTGIDDVWEVMRVAIDLGIIDKAGSWYTLPNGDKFQGEEKMYNALLDGDGVALKSLETAIKAMLC